MSNLYRKLSLFAVAGAFAMLLSGCGQQADHSQTNKQPPQTIPQACKTVEKVPMSETSGKDYVEVFRDAKTCAVTETRTAYRDSHNIEITTFRGPNLMARQVLTDKKGNVLADLQYAADGKTVMSGFKKRDDGTMLYRVAQDAAGNTATTRYWWDGTSLFSITVAKPDGSFATEFHHKLGALWLKRYGPNVATNAYVRQEDFNSNGQLQFVRDTSTPGTEIVTAYDATGKATYQQTFLKKQNDWGGTETNLQKTDEYADDGVTVKRRIWMYNSDSYDRYPGKVELISKDGSKTVHLLGSDGTVTHEEQDDATGKLVSQRDIAARDNVTEKIDRQLLWYPDGDDPQNKWDMAEKYDYYRTGNP